MTVAFLVQSFDTRNFDPVMTVDGRLLVQADVDLEALQGRHGHEDKYVSRRVSHVSYSIWPALWTLGGTRRLKYGH